MRPRKNVTTQVSSSPLGGQFNMKITIIVALLIFCSCRNNHSNETQVKQNVPQSVDSLIVNEDSTSSTKQLIKNILTKKKASGLVGLNLLARFTNTIGQKIYLFEGTSNNEDGSERDMFVVHCLKGIDSIDVQKYDLAGQGYDFLDTLVYEARIFYGNCLDEYPCSIIWYQSEVMKEGNWKTEYYILDVSANEFKSYRKNKNDINLDSILVNVNKMKCYELEGKSVQNTP